MQIQIALLVFAQAIGVPPQPSCDGNPSKEHPGYKTQAGWAITAIDAPKELAVEFLCKGSEGLILLQSVERRTPDGIPVWKILAQKKIKLAKGEGLLTVSTCKVGGEAIRGSRSAWPLWEGGSGRHHAGLPGQSRQRDFRGHRALHCRV